MPNIQGTKNADNLVGSNFSDHINAKNGDDIILGASGDDAIDGGNGTDTAIYQGAFSSYTLTYTGHRDGHGADDFHITITDSDVARDGTDTLTNVEFLQFTDAIFDVGLNVTHFADTTIGGLAVQGPGMGTMWFGSGNLPTHYNVADLNSQNIELGLKIHYRQGYDITPDFVDNNGTAHYTAPAGTQVADPAHGVSVTNAGYAAWNFDYVVNTGVNGSTSLLSDFDFKMVLTQLAGDHAGASATFDLIEDFSPGVHNVWINETNPALGFGGDDGVPFPLLTQLTENSQNFAFGFATNEFGPLANSTAAGTQYGIQLQAFSHGAHGHPQQLIGSVDDIITLV